MSDYDGDQTIGAMTLDEAAENDHEMFRDAVKNTDKYTFMNANHAVKFVAQCIGETLEHLGIKGAYNISDKMLDRLQKTKQIKVERRGHYDGDDVWRNGLYIYQKDILVSFISDIMAPKKSVFLVNMQSDLFYVITNVRPR